MYRKIGANKSKKLLWGISAGQLRINHNLQKLQLSSKLQTSENTTKLRINKIVSYSIENLTITFRFFSSKKTDNKSMSTMWLVCQQQILTHTHTPK